MLDEQVLGMRSELMEWMRQQMRQSMKTMEKKHEQERFEMKGRMCVLEDNVHCLRDDVAQLKAEIVEIKKGGVEAEVEAADENKDIKIHKLEGKCEMLMEMLEKKEKIIQTQQMKMQSDKKKEDNGKAKKAVPPVNGAPSVGIKGPGVGFYQDQYFPLFDSFPSLSHPPYLNPFDTFPRMAHRHRVPFTPQAQNKKHNNNESNNCT